MRATFPRPFRDRHLPPDSISCLQVSLMRSSRAHLSAGRRDPGAGLDPRRGGRSVTRSLLQGYLVPPVDAALMWFRPYGEYGSKASSRGLGSALGVLSGCLGDSIFLADLGTKGG